MSSFRFSYFQLSPDDAGRIQVSENILPTEDRNMDAFVRGSGGFWRPRDGEATIPQILAKMWVEGLFIHCWWGHEFQSLRKSVRTCLKKTKKNLKIELPYDLAVPLLGMLPKAAKSAYHRETCTCVFIEHPSQTQCMEPA